MPTRESLVVCVELIAPEAPPRAIVNSVPLFQVSCSLFVLRVVLFVFSSNESYVYFIGDTSSRAAS